MHHPSNFYDNSAPGDVAFQNSRSYNGSGPTGGCDEIKPEKVKKMREKKRFLMPCAKLSFKFTHFFLNKKVH
jgi:hypothetical protein